VAQREDLELEGGARSKAGAERRQKGEEDCLHGGSKLPHLSGTKHEPPSPAHAPRNSRDDRRLGILGTDNTTLRAICSLSACASIAMRNWRVTGSIGGREHAHQW